MLICDLLRVEENYDDDDDDDDNCHRESGTD